MATDFFMGAPLPRAIMQNFSGARRDIAGAFIGKGALERAALADARGARIICNLWSGGSDPEAIRELRAASATIMNLPQIHAKKRSRGEKRKRLHIAAMSVEKLNASNGWIFARREWPDIAKRIAPGL